MRPESSVIQHADVCGLIAVTCAFHQRQSGMRSIHVLILLVCLACRKDEPMGEGEPLSHWKKEAQKVSMFSFWNSDKDARRREAFRVLSAMGEPAVPVLVELLGKEAPVSGDAFNALTNMGPRAAAAVPEMLSLLESNKPELQLRAAWILGTVGSAAKPAVPKLVGLEKTATGQLREVVSTAVSKITGSRSGASRRRQRTEDGVFHRGTHHAG